MSSMALMKHGLGGYGSWTTWVLVLVFPLRISLCLKVNLTAVYYNDMRNPQNELPGGTLKLMTTGCNQAPISYDIVIQGQGSTLPVELLEEEWHFDSSFTGRRMLVQNATIQEDLPYTALDLRYTCSPFLQPTPGQRLTMRSMILYITRKAIPNVDDQLSHLTMGFMQLRNDSTLRLDDVTIVMSCVELEIIFRSVCPSLETWTYDFEVVMEDGILYIHNLTSWDPGQRGTGSGKVEWLNVTLTCPGKPPGLPAPRPCAARSVGNALELLAAARKALVDEAAGRVLLTVTADISLPTDGTWDPVPLSPNQHLILRGDPARPTTLDLRGLPDVWSLPGDRVTSAPPKDGVPMVILYDLTLVNMPYPSSPNGPMSLLAASLPCFGIARRVLWNGTEQVRAIGSTVIVPDPELGFLADAAIGSRSRSAWPGLPPEGFSITLQERTSDSSSVTQLHVQRLKFMSEVLLTDCVLVSASAYEQLPGAVQLIPQSKEWLPRLLAPRDPDTVQRWGMGGLAVAPGLQQALTDLTTCGKQSGYNPIRILWRHDDSTVPPLGSVSSTPVPPPSSDSSEALEPAANCAVDGSSPWDGGGRVFSDLKGAAGRFSLSRPITLRNLVLYNLAPGATFQGNLSTQALRPSDAAWENSSLPLWFFHCDRSADVSQLPPTRLVLENVTLVVPEREWRAFVAAVLLQHAPEAMAAAQLRQEGPTNYKHPVSPPLSPPIDNLQPPLSPPLSPPPLPPLNDATRDALRGFAVASKALSYNYSTGELVLSAARHYGWRGINVTIAYKLPKDAPDNITLRWYPDGVLPYDNLADMAIDLHVNFSYNPGTLRLNPRVERSPEPFAPAEAPHQEPSTTVMTSASKPPSLPSPEGVAQHHTASNSSASENVQPEPPTVATPSLDTKHSGRLSWLVPLVASLSAATLLVAAVVMVVVRARQRHVGRCSKYTQEQQHSTRQHRWRSLIGDKRSSIGTIIMTEGIPPLQSGCTEVRCSSGSLKNSFATSPWTTIPGIASSPISGRRAPGSNPVGNSSDNSSTVKANRAALMHAFAKLGSSGNAITPAPAELEAGKDGGCEDSNGDPRQEVRRDNVASVPANIGTDNFLKELQAYYRALMSCELEPASRGLLKRQDTDNSENALEQQPSRVVKVHGQRNISDAIKALQATMKDKDLRLDYLIGSGAFGAVYRGMWCGLLVAVKMLVVANDLTDKENQTKRRMVLEAAISISMAHPNVVVTYSYDLEPLVHAPVQVDKSSSGMRAAQGPRDTNPEAPWGADLETCDAVRLYIVQEYCNGGTLRNALDRGMAGCARAAGAAGNLARLLALDVALGMQHIHSLRIVHGDLKPENVLLVFGPRLDTTEGLASLKSSGGSEPKSYRSVPSAGSLLASALSDSDLHMTAKVADFGLSTPLSAGATHASKLFHGTPAYQAPEVAATGQMSPRSDVWSYGIILLELYFGCSLYDMHNVYTTVRPPPSGHEAGGVGRFGRPSSVFLKDVLLSITDRSYAELVQSCLSLEPRDRPGFGELVEVLQKS